MIVYYLGYMINDKTDYRSNLKKWLMEGEFREKERDCKGWGGGGAVRRNNC